MAKQTLNTLKNWFKKGLKPLESQFADWLDSFWHKDATDIPINSIQNLQNTLNNLASTGSVAALNAAKEDKSNKGAANGYAPLGPDQKVPAENLPPIASTLESVLTVGNDANAQQIKNLANPTAAQDADTLSARNAALAVAIAQLVDGAGSGDNTLKKLADKILALQSIVGGTDPDGDNIVDTVAELLAVFQTYNEGVDVATVLAGKVNTSDVYNSLDQLVAGKVLDARQGKVLKDLIDANTSAIGTKLTGTRATDAETQISGAVAEDDKFVTRVKLFNWWSWVRTQAATITASLWTFVNIRLTGQASAAGTFRLLVTDDQGNVLRSVLSNYDPTTGTLTLKGINTLSTGFTLTVLDGNDNLVARFRNDRTVEFGTDGVCVIRVRPEVTAGNASIDFRDIEGEQFVLKDQASNRYLGFEKLSAVAAGNLLLPNNTRVTRERVVELFDKGVGQTEVKNQIIPVVTTAVIGQNIVAEFTIPNNTVLSLTALHLQAVATDGSVVRYPLELTARNVAGAVTQENNLSVAGLGQKAPNTLTASFNVNVSGTTVQIRLNNDNPGPKAYTINFTYSYILTTIPV